MNVMKYKLSAIISSIVFSSAVSAETYVVGACTTNTSGISKETLILTAAHVYNPVGNSDDEMLKIMIVAGGSAENKAILNFDEPLQITIDMPDAEVGAEYLFCLLFAINSIGEVTGGYNQQSNYILNTPAGSDQRWIITEFSPDEDLVIGDAVGKAVFIKATNQSVPEPSTTTLGLLGLGAILLRRRRNV